MGVSVWKMQQGSDRMEPVQFDPPVETLDESSQRVPQGVYTTFRTYDHDKALLLEHHFNRLEDSCQRLGKKLQLDRFWLRDKLRIAIKYYTNNTKIRITIISDNGSPVFFLAADDLIVLPDQVYQTGAGALTRALERTNPKAKQTGFINNTLQLRDELRRSGVNEIIMIGEDGTVLEGLSSNFYAVINGKVFTEDERVLNGMTRELVLDISKEVGIQIILAGIQKDQLPAIDEAFITSAGRGVLPITTLDGIRVGNGVPGPVTQKIRQAYNKKVLELIEPI